LETVVGAKHYIIIIIQATHTHAHANSQYSYLIVGTAGFDNHSETAEGFL